MSQVDANIGSNRYLDWVEAEKDKAHLSIFAQIKQYDSNYNSTVQGNTIRGIKQYLNRGMNSMSAWGYLAQSAQNQQLGMNANTPKVNFNLTAAAIDTLTAKLANIPVTPQAVTNMSTVKGKRLADDINTILKGTFYNKQVSKMINLAFRGAMIARAEYIKVYVEDGKLHLDKVHMDEVLVDPLDGYYNDPYKIMQRKYVPLHVAINRWPKFKDKFEQATMQELRQYSTNTYTPCVVICEAWCKNSYKEGGRHVICIENATIVDEEWDKDYFPIVKCEYNPPVVGYMGQSVVDELAPIQQEIDRILLTMQAIMKIVSVPRVFVDTNAMVNDAHFTNKIGIIVKYDGKQGVAPVIHNGAAMPPELPEQLEFLINQGFTRVGLSQLDIQGQKPAGVVSGDALETLQNSGSERWKRLKDAYQQAHIEVAQVILNELADHDVKITALDRQIGLTEISSRKIPKTEGAFVLQIYPSSSLPSSIAERLDVVSKMVQMGILPVSQVPELFQMPDIEGVLSKQSSPMKLMDFILEEMETTKKYIPPEPYFDLNYALSAALQKYSMIKLNEGDEKFLSLIRRFINDVRTLLKQAAVTAMPQQVAPQSSQPTNPPPPVQGQQ